MEDVAAALKREGAWHPDEARAALGALREECLACADSRGGPASPRESEPSLAAFHEAVRRALESVRSGDLASGASSVKQARGLWPDVEARVKTSDAALYALCEEMLPEAERALCGPSPDAEKAARALERVEGAIAPLAGAPARYGADTVALILLREGAEAILVLAALVAFLSRLGAPEKVRLVWAGGAIGLAASVAGGLGLALAMKGVASASSRREVVEGISSLVAAALLVIVGQWLHAKIRRGGWKTQVQEAVREGRSLSLLLVAFFAVFREGAETVLFFLGIAPSLDARAVVLGIASGSAALLALAVVVLGLGKRMPLAPFFRAATLLLWALAFKFVGEGVHALQAGDALPSTRIASLPSLPLVGFYATWETSIAQGAALLVFLGFEVGPRLLRRDASKATARPEPRVPASG